jgi:hypothetical protein
MTNAATLTTPEIDDEADLVEGPICGACNEPCQVVTSDQGIGSYEFWGATGVDTDIQTLSDCCDATAYTDSNLDEACEAEDPDDYCPDDYDRDEDY